ncbi:branched-chain amino acid ABC transporter permease [Desulforegula conservatrix]|uniref:branched-chain amino acid ABC transporter permease n=1 Tax=Desulforegula conservatrix TaxID=153026 RepID=UPI00041583C1|nr:branched-chain amino acid ABC transporter permease [Desulforegula conservatrix]
MKNEIVFNRACFAVLITLVAAAGFFIDNSYYIQTLTLIGINTLLALGLNLLMGYAGQISLGHAAFFAIGSYTTAILTTKFMMSPWLALPAALVLAAAVAYVVGIPTLRLSGYYLGMGTLGFGMIVNICIREWDSYTGGASGLVGIPGLSSPFVSFENPRNFFFLVWAVLILFFIASQRIMDSRVGRALRAIHDNEAASLILGVDTKDLKLKIFVLSAVMAAVSGFLYAHMITFISPGTFDFLASIRIVTMVVIGGMASIWGALFGASLLTLLPEWLHSFADFEMMIYGLILMVVMIFMPQGLTRGLIDIYEQAKSKK